ncbi:trehalose operon repressor [Lactobacillus taiwanensis]|uniref:trehalose operon repressor n=2 Tax=Lactobacillus TaxID=1578 RepID=UPI000B97E98B|nr:trehalose operon repressor [Lactobacillus taiwanensis]OYR95034.1 trehalose operon repressor [Lactobacillus taiwanensis]OYS02873.1 trehalose operon repressor [Lactobacillus taiwanensis]OYS12464.1 trehalose operon repressor [Lactobacillus taiwanensis]OYS32938.1 trehalose operon repressor [Lactobacillus taiwanensis]OYS34983.1 trehalose operon repressor [Lactobacillus taiwanensis]
MAQSKVGVIAQDLVDKIKHQQYQAGDYLPSEHQLMDLYGSSRETIRKALNSLTDLGLIQKIRGKGSIVLNLDRYTFPISGITSFAELNNQLGLKAETKVLLLQKEDKLPVQFIKYFPEEENSTGFHLERLRLIDGQADVLDCDYLLSPPVNSLPREAAETSIYDYLENKQKLDISYATKEISVCKVDKRIQDLLQLDNDLAVLVASRNYLADTTKFELTLSYHRPDKFKFVDFARRKKIKL